MKANQSFYSGPCTCGAGPYHGPTCPCQIAYKRELAENPCDPTEVLANYPVDVWSSVSNKHRIIARLPDGKTGREALAECDLELSERMPESACRGYYLRVYAERDGMWAELSLAEWKAWRAAGGRSA